MQYVYMYFTFFLEWKTRNKHKIHQVHLLVDEKKYIGDLFVVDLIQRKNCY